MSTTDASNNYEGTVLFWLLSPSDEQNDLSVPIASFQKIINDTRIFFDPDQCIDNLASVTDLTIFLVLGPTRSDLLPVLRSFDYLRRIYLSELHEYAQNNDQVRGVFPTIHQLIPYLERDVRMAQQVDCHLIVTYMGDPIQSHRSMADLQTSKADFQWKQALIDVVRSNTTSSTKNTHKDLIDEWRLVYRSNIRQTKYIDEFEATYDSSNAIYWYTRGTFLYKMVNMALRRENIVVIWRLRFYIRDMYRQLGQLHEQQREASISTQQDVQILYRGQHMSASELTQLKKCEGGMIATTSFVSTTRNLAVAKRFAGNGEGRPACESVIFKIVIYKSAQDYGRSPFADISALSSMLDEEEVLLCLGTVLKVVSVQTKGQVIWVRVCLCEREESEVLRQIKIDMSNPFPKAIEVTDELVFARLAYILISMGDFHKLGQIAKIFKSPKISSTNSLVTPVLQLFSIGPTVDELGIWAPDLPLRSLTVINRVQQMIQSLLRSDTLDPRLRNHLNACQPLLDAFPHLNGSNLDLSRIATAIEAIAKNAEENGFGKCLDGISDRLRKAGVAPLSTLTACQDPASVNSAYARTIYDETFREKILQRIIFCLSLAIDAKAKHNFEEAIRLLREGLTIPTDTLWHVPLYQELISIYKKQENWLAAIGCCQDIINMPQLPPNSSHIVNAYMDSGFLCRKLNDYSEALLYYTKALKVQHQHNPPRHPRAAEIYVQMGILFYAVNDKTTAIEHFQSAIAFDFPESTSEAHKWIAHLSQQVEH